MSPLELFPRAEPANKGPLCSRCNGTGWTVEPDGGAGTAVRCTCQAKRKQLDMVAQSGLPTRYRRCRLNMFSTVNSNKDVAAQLLRARTVSQRYVETFLDPISGESRRRGLLYIGPPGVGKTHLAAAVLVELIQRYGQRGRFVDFSTLLHQIQSTFDQGSAETKSSLLRPVIQADVLVLDELGAQRPTEWVMDVLYLIMNTRYTDGRPTLFTSNYRLSDDNDPPGKSKDLKASELSQRINAALLSRLYEMAEPLILDGPDYRRQVKSHEERIGA